MALELNHEISRLVLPVALAAVAGSAHAGLSGSTVDLKFLYPDTSTTFSDAGNAVVGAGIEYTSIGGYAFDFDLTNTTLTITAHFGSAFNVASFNGFSLGVVSGPALSSVSYASGTFVPGATRSAAEPCS